MNYSDFFNMGGYAFYVWMSYGIALAVLTANLVLPAWQKRELLRRIVRRMKREAKHQ